MIFEMVFMIFWNELTVIYIFRLKVYMYIKYIRKRLTVIVQTILTCGDKMEDEQLTKTKVIYLIIIVVTWVVQMVNQKTYLQKIQLNGIRNKEYHYGKENYNI